MCLRLFGALCVEAERLSAPRPGDPSRFVSVAMSGPRSGCIFSVNVRCVVCLPGGVQTACILILIFFFFPASWHGACSYPWARLAYLCCHCSQEKPLKRI